MSRKSLVDDYEWIRLQRERIQREKEEAQNPPEEPQDTPDHERSWDYNGDAP